MLEKLKQLLKEKQIPFNLDKLTLHKDNQDNYYGVLFDYMGTGIHLKSNEVDEDECKEIGLKIWHTWTINI